MKFGLFMYCTIGRRDELEAGMAGCKPELYQRMLDEIAGYASFADIACPAVAACNALEDDIDRDGEVSHTQYPFLFPV